MIAAVWVDFATRDALRLGLHAIAHRAKGFIHHGSRFCSIQSGSAIFAGFPIVTLTKTTLPGTWHWVVIYGVGRRPNRVFVSGYHLFRSTVFHWPEFRAEWADPGYGIVCWGK